MRRVRALEGRSFKHPPTRTTNAQTTNHQKANGDAPSILGRSCDEYPTATSKQGLSSGGTRRTFSGSDLPNNPSGSGSKGAGTCMINREDNSVAADAWRRGSSQRKTCPSQNTGPVLGGRLVGVAQVVGWAG
ncbi:hypothetical protein [Streptomyces sp. NPDC094149]|uniref:hypothetical protein n=1 Tax=Streptomyces sp. NPDC094149 TaxID=3155079 RepID=UPI003320C6CD